MTRKHLQKVVSGSVSSSVLLPLSLSLSSFTELSYTSVILNLCTPIKCKLPPPSPLTPNPLPILQPISRSLPNKPISPLSLTNRKSSKKQPRLPRSTPGPPTHPSTTLSQKQDTSPPWLRIIMETTISGHISIWKTKSSSAIPIVSLPVRRS